jgi:acyl-CoA synthetase (AMP-forming)/AMP-acid ligase II
MQLEVEAVRLFPDDVAQRCIDDGWWSGQTWSDLLERNRSAAPATLALVDAPNRATLTFGTPRRLTWAEVDDEVSELAGVLLAHGVRRDDVVGVQLPNVAELPMVFLALTRIGAIVSPFPVQYGRHELSGMGAAAGLTAFITVERAVGRELAAGALELTADVPSLATVFVLGTDVAGTVRLDQPVEGGRERVAEHRRTWTPHANDCATLVWTSGTEGTPKGVPRAYGDWQVLADAVSEVPRVSGDDVFLSPFPMTNGGGISGMFIPWLIHATRLVLHHPFDLEVFLSQVEQERVTYTCAPPAILDALVADDSAFEQHDLSSLRAVSSGSAPLSGWMIARWERDHGVEVLNFFGSNEGTCLFGDPDTMPDPELRGRLFPRYGLEDFPYRARIAQATRTKLVDLSDGTEITAPGRAGELRLTGPSIFAGYWGRGRDGFDEEGWYRTGDVFEIPEEQPHCYVLVDRAKDLIIRGGYNISAVEIEGLVIGDPGVAEVAAVALPDERLGERVCLFVVPRDPDDPPTLERLVDRLRERGVARFKWPERLELVAELPRNPIGKILKRELRDRLHTETGAAS